MTVSVYSSTRSFSVLSMDLDFYFFQLSRDYPKENGIGQNFGYQPFVIGEGRSGMFQQSMIG